MAANGESEAGPSGASVERLSITPAWNHSRSRRKSAVRESRIPGPVAASPVSVHTWIYGLSRCSEITQATEAIES